MQIIGITGGIGSGKSTVLELLEKNFNAYIIKADDVAKETMEPEHPGYEKVVEIFGETILGQDKTIDRNKLSDIVFHSANKRAVLNSIIHPLVKKLITEQTGYLKCREDYDYIFIEAALLIEDHYDIICDELWYIFAPEDIRTERLKRSRNYEESKIQNIFASQLKPEEYKKHCKRIIYNDGDLEHTLKQLQEALAEQEKR